MYEVKVSKLTIEKKKTKEKSHLKRISRLWAVLTMAHRVG
jgi:hypothetical protein